MKFSIKLKYFNLEILEVFETAAFHVNCVLISDYYRENCRNFGMIYNGACRAFCTIFRIVFIVGKRFIESILHISFYAYSLHKYIFTVV